MDQRPEYGARTYTISIHGKVEMIDQFRRYRPVNGEDEGAMLRRIARILRPPLAVEFIYHRGEIRHADVRSLKTDDPG